MVYNYYTIVLVLVGLVAVIPTLDARATVLGDVGNNADTGFDAGRIAGIADKQNGEEHDSKCPPNDSLIWCGAYKVGYSTGYYAQGIVKANEDNNNNNNN